MSEHVIACDPGGRSGWASARMSEDRLEFTGSGVLREDLMPDWLGKTQYVGYYGDGGNRSNVFRSEFDVFVYESWYPRTDDNGKMDWITGSTLATPQQIGALRWIARQSGAKIVTQHPTDKTLAQATMPGVFAQLNRDSTEQHDQDARMHLWLYFWRNWFIGKVGPGEVFVGV